MKAVRTFCVPKPKKYFISYMGKQNGSMICGDTTFFCNETYPRQHRSHKTENQRKFEIGWKSEHYINNKAG